MISRTTFLRGLAALAVSAAAFTPAVAADVADTYKGKTLTILIGHPPGGSYDLYAQLAAAHLGKYIPGEPNIIVQHMPGGGGRKGAAHFAAKVDPDGLTIALLPDTLAHIQLLQPKRAKWDASKFTYIGRFAPANAAFAIRKDAPATTIEAMKDKEIVVACTGKSARSAQMPALLKNVAGLKLRLICGYKGSKAATLATLRGEVDMTSKNWASFKSGDAAELEAGNLKIVLQAGLERDPDLPDVPLLQEIVDDAKAKEVLRFLGSGAPIGRSLMVAPGTSSEIVAALREAFDKMVADSDFLADAEKRKAIINPAKGADIDMVNQEIMTASADLIAAAIEGMDTSGAGELPK